MKFAPIISGFVIWITCLIIRILYLTFVKYSLFSLNKIIYSFKLSLFFFSPLLLLIIIMQYLETKYIILRKNNFFYAILCFGLIGIFYVSFAYNNISNNNSEVFIESFYSLIAGLIYYMYNHICKKE